MVRVASLCHQASTSQTLCCGPLAGYRMEYVDLTQQGSVRSQAVQSIYLRRHVCRYWIDVAFHVHCGSQGKKSLKSSWLRGRPTEYGCFVAKANWDSCQVSNSVLINETLQFNSHQWRCQQASPTSTLGTFQSAFVLSRFSKQIL